MSKYKIGDKVKIVELYDKSKIGTVGVVNDIMYDIYYCIDDSNNYIQDSCLELCEQKILT